jgi:hypothetical protein
MINQDKWINSLPKTNIKFSEEKNQIDHDKWINTISKKNTYSAFSKYTFMTVLFVCGLLFVSTIKNGTRNLEKEINNLRTSISEVKFDLDQAILDNEVINSPENISRLAKEHLETDLITYKKSQIIQLGEDSDIVIKTTKKNSNLSTKIKLKIENKKAELRNLQALYSKPKSIPGEIKIQVAKKIEEKKIELKNLYSSPKDTFTLVKAQKWAAVQLVKAFLGIPVIPGR